MNAGSSHKKRPSHENKVLLYDTTLRDGAQTEGVNFSLEDKISVAKRLSGFGFDCIEGGWPSSGRKDIEFFRQAKDIGLKSDIAAFGMTSKDPGSDKKIEDLMKTEADILTIFGKAWDLHVKHVLGVSEQENLRMVSDTIDFLKSSGFRVFFDAEHFFDGYKRNPLHALKVLGAAEEASAVILCDTNGSALPWEVGEAVAAVSENIRVPLGIHAHNDSGMAAVNSLTALKAGAVHVQGTVNGLGERCGNADWCEMLPLMTEKMGLKHAADNSRLMKISRYVEQVSGFNVAKNKPFVGANAFSHKGGVHIDAMIKNPLAYEHMNPEKVGNTRSFSLSDQAGRAGIMESAKRHGFEVQKDDDVVIEAMEKVKGEEYVTDAELFLFFHRKLGKGKEPFRLQDYETSVSSEGTAKTAIKLEAGGREFHEIAEGVGPVHSLDMALKKALENMFDVGNVRLSNFRVRILDSEKATAARVEVFISFRAEDMSWSASGISDDVIKASGEALIKGYKFYLLKKRGETDVGS